METKDLIAEIKKALKSGPVVIDTTKELKKDQVYTWTLLASILEIEPVDSLSDLKDLCIQELGDLDETIAVDPKELESAIWDLLSPQKRAPFIDWLLTNNDGKPLSGSKKAYVTCIELLAYYYKINLFSSHFTESDLNDLNLYTETKKAQKNGNAIKWYSSNKSYAKYYYSSSVKNYGKYLKSSGSLPATTGAGSAPEVPILSSSEGIHNLILYGPPGTGKTYYSIRYALSIIEGLEVSDIDKDNPFFNKTKSEDDIKEAFKSYVNDERIRFITFHQSLSYEDFIEGIKPTIDDQSKQVKYDYEPGLFKQVCDDARKTDDRYVLIIDEINRGNVAQIFGELITLLEEDKREGCKNELSCILPYSKKSFSVPNNLYIIGTMNTADRSVEALDTALRRRFSFIEMLPNAELVPKDWRPYFEAINKRIEILKDSEHQIGHSYFIDVKDKTGFRRVFRNNIIPLLQEYFFGDVERIRMVIGDGFFKEVKSIQEDCFPGYRGDIDIPSSIWKIWGKKDWEKCEEDSSIFDAALDTLLGKAEAKSEPEDDQS